MADTNLLQGKMATGNSSVAPYQPSCATDGTRNLSRNRWLSYKVPGWLMVDLQVPCVISRWAAYFLPNASDAVTVWQPALYGMRNYSLQTSMDTLTWTTVDSVANNASNYTDRTLGAVAVGRFVRFYAGTGLSGNTQNAISLLEFEAYGHAVNADLSSLVLSSGALVPAFTPGGTTYTQQVGYDTDSITVTPTTADSTAIVTVNGVSVASGQASGPIHLGVGNNAITVVVTPVYGPSKAYTVTVNRADSQYLTSLTLNAGTSQYNVVPTFSKTLSAYTATVPFDASTVTVTPVAEGTTSTIMVNGTVVASGAASAPIPMSVGANAAITVECSLPSGVKQTYTITVTREDSLLLTQAVVSPVGKGAGSPITVQMNATDTTYGATVAANTVNFTVTSTAASPTASITVNNGAVASGQPSPSIALSSNPTTVQIVVTSSSGSASRAYTINVGK